MPTVVYTQVRDLSEAASVQTYPAMFLLEHHLPRRSGRLPVPPLPRRSLCGMLDTEVHTVHRDYARSASGALPASSPGTALLPIRKQHLTPGSGLVSALPEPFITRYWGRG